MADVLRGHIKTLPVEREETMRGGSVVGASSHATCEGCLLRPDRACAVCGAPASVWTDAGDGRHAVAWCAPCHDLLLSGRPASAPPLVYLSVREARPA